MKEIKTLKDLFDDDWYEENDIYFIDANEVVDLTKEELKAEAVKWVKEDLRCMKDMEEEDYLYICADARVDFIKHFFNLTEEDLEEKENEI